MTKLESLSILIFQLLCVLCLSVNSFWAKLLNNSSLWPWTSMFLRVVGFCFLFFSVYILLRFLRYFILMKNEIPCECSLSSVTGMELIENVNQMAFLSLLCQNVLDYLCMNLSLPPASCVISRVGPGRSNILSGSTWTTTTVQTLSWSRDFSSSFTCNGINFYCQIIYFGPKDVFVSSAISVAICWWNAHVSRKWLFQKSGTSTQYLPSVLLLA